MPISARKKSADPTDQEHTSGHHGRIADFRVVKGAPDRHIEDIRKVANVFKEGRAHDAAKLRQGAKEQLGLH